MEQNCRQFYHNLTFLLNEVLPVIWGLLLQPYTLEAVTELTGIMVIPNSPLKQIPSLPKLNLETKAQFSAAPVSFHYVFFYFAAFFPQ